MYKINEYVDGKLIGCHLTSNNINNIKEKLYRMYLSIQFIINENLIDYKEATHIKYTHNNSNCEVKIEKIEKENNSFVAILSPNIEIISEILSENEFNNLYPKYGDYKDLDLIWGDSKKEVEEIANELIKQADKNREYFGN